MFFAKCCIAVALVLLVVGAFAQSYGLLEAAIVIGIGGPVAAMLFEN